MRAPPGHSVVVFSLRLRSSCKHNTVDREAAPSPCITPRYPLPSTQFVPGKPLVLTAKLVLILTHSGPILPERGTSSWILTHTSPYRHPTNQPDRLQKALDQVRATDPPVTFTLTLNPFQLDPSFPTTPVPKSEFYNSRFGDRAALIHAHMGSLGAAEGINFAFGGVMANTLPAHRVLQVARREKGEEAAWKVLDGLYRRYFEEEAHPSSPETLEAACLEAGLEESWVKEVVGDEERGLQEVKRDIRNKRSEGVDSVPHIVFEGVRRDITLTGAREVDEYVKTLQAIIKESQ